MEKNFNQHRTLFKTAQVENASKNYLINISWYSGYNQEGGLLNSINILDYKLPLFVMITVIVFIATRRSDQKPAFL